MDLLNGGGTSSGATGTPGRTADASSPRDILVLKPSSLGDIVHALPAVALLKRHWPNARLHWMVNPEWAPLLDGNPSVYETVLFPRNQFRGIRGILKVPRWLKTMRRTQRADLVIDFQGLLRSAIIGKLCSRDESVGMSDAREGARFFYHRVADVRDISHAVDRYLALVKSLGVDISAPLEWQLPEGLPPKRFPISEPYILLHPFSRGMGKSLSVPDVLQFCKALQPSRVVLAGRTSLNLPRLSHIIDLTNQTSLLELVWLLRKAAYIVSVDSGPMHIGAALTSRLVSIHTWSDPSKVGPYQPNAWIWKASEIFQMKNLNDPEKHERVENISGAAEFVKSQL